MPSGMENENMRTRLPDKVTIRSDAIEAKNAPLLEFRRGKVKYYIRMVELLPNGGRVCEYQRVK